MTTTEKIQGLDFRLDYNEILVLEKIADEFAIGFAEWIANGHSFVDDVGPSTTKQLLEIYKKEQQL